MFPPIFVVDTKIIYGYNFVAPLNVNLLHKCKSAPSMFSDDIILTLAGIFVSLKILFTL